MAVACSTLICADARANTPVIIDEIQVTATRKATSIGSISIGVTVVHKEQLALQNLVTDALAGQAGAFVQETTPGQGAIIIRGMKGSEILHLVDSVRLNNAIFRNAPTQYAALVDPRIIERIEVVRGSVASLYGSDAMGGAGNFITHKPQYSDSDGSLTSDLHLSANSADLAKSVSVGVEASDETLAGLARISYFDSGNRQTGESSRIPFTAFSYEAARLALRGAPDPRNNWLLDFQYLKQPKTYRVDELVPGYGQTEPGSSEFTFEPNERAFAHASYELLQGIWSTDWIVDLGWQRIVDDRTTRAYQSDTRNLERNSSDLLSFNLEAIKETANRTWVYGAALLHDKVRSFREQVDISTGLGSEITPRFPDESTIDQSAVYARLQQPLGERNNFSFGGRYSAVDTHVTGTEADSASTIRFTDLTGDIGWVYTLTENWNLVANVGRGFRAPNIFDLGTLGARPGNRFNIPNDNLEAETVINFDVGVSHMSARWSGDVRLYALRYEDKIESVATGDTTTDGRQVTQSRNLSSVDVNGVEFSGEIALSDDISFGAILNFARGEAQLPDQEITPADRIPPLNGQVELDWHLGEQWLFNTYLRFAAAQDRLSPRDASDPRINPNGTPGWMTANLNFTFRPDERLAIVLAIENIFNQQYRIHGSGIDARGLNLGASVNVRW